MPATLATASASQRHSVSLRQLQSQQEEEDDPWFQVEAQGWRLVPDRDGDRGVQGPSSNTGASAATDATTPAIHFFTGAPRASSPQTAAAAIAAAFASSQWASATPAPGGVSLPQNTLAQWDRLMDAIAGQAPSDVPELVSVEVVSVEDEEDHAELRPVTPREIGSPPPDDGSPED